MEIEGKVKEVGVEVQVTQAYTKRELVVTTDEQYPQTIMIEFPQGKCNDYLDKLVIGENVKVSINLGGREWVNPQGETKYFNSIKGWRIEKLDQEEQQAAVMQASVKPTAFPPATSISEEDGSDLPFN